MSNIEDSVAQIKNKIIQSFQDTKTKLFRSSGKIYGYSWDDLTPKYKKWKKQKLGTAYPINIFTGDLLNDLLDKAIEVEVSYDSETDNANFKITVNSDKIGLDYADAVNEKREYISFSDEEKLIITAAVNETVRELFGENA